ncbi:hypothetical protein [Sinorhizobium meliloti]|uniref:hypothetical protein n=1 Tax=Rhizobium meliloti TaxID=382 RepID=UPI000FD78F04|nr:hypothetical protein [Sinorhizobium meliloti]RVL02457.1 hypothetical protein CN152_09670 [Sinorhizobium meliloti]RVN44105.1 hypothetical protein CN113_21175 [Sinorhizobium meliloti]
MAHPDLSPQQKRMDAIRNRISFAARDWGIQSDGGKLCLTAATGEGNFLVATIANDAPIGESELVLSAPGDLIWLLETYDALAGRFRTLHAELRRHAPRQQLREPKDYAAECAMKCAEPAFKVFLEECHGLAKPLTDDRAATKVRSILKIGSRSELNGDPAAAARWQDLRSAFDAWRRRG